ncbi:MAG: integrase core domain-containing protein [Bdellovibrionota bacterium]
MKYGIDEIKNVPSCPWSHPFIERKIGSYRQDFTDHTLFYSKPDIEAKFSHHIDYFNRYQVHAAHEGRTPREKDGIRDLETIKLDDYHWKPVCRGLFHAPIAA